MDAQKIIEELLKILAKKNGAEIKIKKIVKKEVATKFTECTGIDVPVR